MGMKVKVYKKKEGSTLMWDGIHKIAIAFNEPLLH